MTEACKTLDQFIHACIASKREKLSKYNENEMGEAHHVDLLTALMREGKAHDDKFLRDAVFNLFVAGRDTITSALTWFFWLVATNPSVEAKILEEMKEKLGTKEKVEERKVLRHCFRANLAWRRCRSYVRWRPHRGDKKRRHRLW